MMNMKTSQILSSIGITLHCFSLSPFSDPLYENKFVETAVDQVHIIQT
jgi:hypothetical protein